MRSLFALFLFPAFVSAQVTLKGNVADAGSGRCLPFASIGFSGKENGTIARENGSFEMVIPADKAKDKIMISAAGYKSRMVTADSLKSYKITVTLTPIKLKEIKVNPGQKDLIGYLTDAHDPARAAMLNTPGSEEAALIQNQDSVLIKTFNLRIAELNYDSLLLRVNIYKADKDIPGEKLNKTDHFFTLNKISNEAVRIVLNENIICTGNFFVSLEYVKGDGQTRKFDLLSFDDKNENAFTRSTALAKWKKSDLQAPGFWVEVEKQK